MTSPKSIFLTGATGLVGSYLLSQILKNPVKVFVLARANYSLNSENRIHQLLSFWDIKSYKKNKNKIVLIEGDLTQEHLGISQNIHIRLMKEVEIVYHCAALTKFNATYNELKDHNIDGTTRILELCRRWLSSGQFKKLNYISTAYIAGNHKKKFDEHDFDVNQSFVTPYQKSKFEAEKIVREYRQKGIWSDIFRPPAVSGESNTGKISTLQQTLPQTIKTLRLEIYQSLPISKTSTVNIIPVDHLVNSLLILGGTAYPKNSTYHLFSNKAFSCREFIETTCNYLHLKNINFCTLRMFSQKASFAQKTILKSNLYFIDQVSLSSQKTNRILQRTNSSIPPFTASYLKKLLYFCLQKSFIKRIV